MIKFTNIIAILVFLLTSYVDYAHAGTCYSASNFGLGGQVSVRANPDENNTSIGKDSNLLRTTVGDQVARWQKTPFFTTGVAGDPDCTPENASSTTNYGCRPDRGVLKMYVEDGWFPWGEYEDAGECAIIDCTPNGDDLDPDANLSACFMGDGKRIDKGNDDSKLPCKITTGWGLYGLIALDKGGGAHDDPNTSAEIAEKPPSASFRTFRTAPLENDSDGKYFKIDFTKQCDLSDSSGTANFECNEDSDGEGSNFVPRGKLFFQIKDRHYQDNAGGYLINIVSGVFVPDGFIESMVKSFERHLDLVVQGMYNKLINDSNLLGMIRAMLLLYITLYGLMFMMGMVEIQHNDMIVRLIKIGLIMTMISEGSWEFFNNNFFELFKSGARYIASEVLDASLYYNSDRNSPRFILPENATALSIYDILVQMLLSSAIHAKIAALLFYKYFFIFIPFIYVALFFVFKGIIKAIVLYFSALILVAVLTVSAPIFLVMMLFKITKDLFEKWLEQLIASAMMIIILSAAMAVLILLMMNQIENLFGYRVCWEVIFTLITDKVFFLDWFDFKWFKPSDGGQMEEHVNFENFIAFLIVAVIFDKIMRDIPGFIDALSAAQLQPMAQLTYGATHRLTQAAGKAVSAAEYARAGLTMTRKGVTKGADLVLSKSNKYQSYKKEFESHKESIKKSKIYGGIKAGAGVIKTATKAAVDSPQLLDSALKTQVRSAKEVKEVNFSRLKNEVGQTASGVGKRMQNIYAKFKNRK